MASRLIHLTIAHLLAEKLNIGDKNRFFIGQILPDAVLHADKKTVRSHFDTRICSDTKKIMNFNEFFNRYEAQIFSDSLYLGYYFHLIQDAVFRMFLYYELGFINKRGDAEFLKTLYADYHSINGYLAEKYALNSPIIVPENFADERINEIYAFEITEFIADMHNDLSDTYTASNEFFTAEDTERFIEKCVCKCSEEYIEIGRKCHAAVAYDYAWQIYL